MLSLGWVSSALLQAPRRHTQPGSQRRVGSSSMLIITRVWIEHPLSVDLPAHSHVPVNA